MDVFDRAARAGVVFGVALALVAAAFMRSSPAQSPRTEALPSAIALVLDRNQDSLADAEILHDEHLFVAWRSDHGVQQCLTIVMTVAVSISESEAGDLRSGRTCGPPGVAPSEHLFLSRAVANEENRIGVAVFALPDRYASEDWEPAVGPEPTVLLRGVQSFALVYRGEDWPTIDDGIRVEVTCICGTFEEAIAFPRAET